MSTASVRLYSSPETAVIDKYLGTPFRWGGRVPGVHGGMDCWTLVASIMADLGHKVWEIDGSQYPAGPEVSHNYFIQNYHRQWDEITNRQWVKPFDVVLMKGPMGMAAHVGVVLSGGRVIHCPKAGVVVTQLDDPAWSKKVLGFYRLRVAA